MVVLQKMSKNPGAIGCQIHTKTFGSNPVHGTLH